MSTLSKLVLGAMGALRPLPALGNAAALTRLPPPLLEAGGSLMEALKKRSSAREYRNDPLPLPLLSSLLWAANGINRKGGGRTAPSALNAQEIDIVVALPEGAYRYDAAQHALDRICATDIRRVTGYQDFVDDAPLDLVYVADHARMKAVPVAQRTAYANVAAGAIAQNVYLFCASQELCTVLRAWIDREAVCNALGLPHDQEVLLSQTVGFAKA
ncbi:MAG: SagB/ThcOx family dehydrogenase [Cytophagales bacterium]|nr:SagB/ThcOx family dehydrogenase [Rhizobacter sp.]